MIKNIINYSDSESSESVKQQESLGKRKIDYNKLTDLLQKHKKIDNEEIEFRPIIQKEDSNKNQSLLNLSKPKNKTQIPQYQQDKDSEDEEEDQEKNIDELKINEMEQFQEKPKEKNFLIDDSKMISISAQDLLDVDWMKLREQEKRQKEIRGFQPIMAPTKTEKNKHQLQSLAYDIVQNQEMQEQYDQQTQDRKKNTQLRYGW